MTGPVLESVARFPTRQVDLEHDSWLPVDLAAVLAGEHTDQAPQVLARDDAVALFYPGKLHSVSGESESLKTWLLLVAAAQELKASRPVLWLDFEDAPGSLARRLLALGVSQDLLERSFLYIRPHEPPAPGWRIPEALTNPRPTLTVIDGVTEAMGLFDLDPNSATDVAAFLSRLARPLAASGAATVLVDHVVKSRENRGRYAIGSQHKLAAVDGAAFLVELEAPFGHGKRGIAHVNVSKDRPGHVRGSAVGNRVAKLVLTSEPDGSVSVELLAPDDNANKPVRPDALMEHVSRWLEAQAEPRTGREITSAIRGNQTALRTAIRLLINEGHVDKQPGPRRAIFHSHIAPYRNAGSA